MGIGAYGFGLTSVGRGLLALLEGVLCQEDSLCGRGLLGFWVWLGVPALALVLLVMVPKMKYAAALGKPSWP